jgi:hypothetical protein
MQMGGDYFEQKYKKYFLKFLFIFLCTIAGTLLPDQGLPLKLICFVGFAQE